MKIFPFHPILAGLASICVAGLTLAAEFQVTVKAVDEASQPVPGASVGFSWGRLGDNSSDTGHKRAETNEQGRVVFSERTKFPDFAYGASRDGFYPTRGLEGHFLKMTGDRWEPWDLKLSVILRPVKNPVSMYAARVRGSLPAKDVWLGYDLQKSDWLPPYGAGEQADFEFMYQGLVEDDLNYDGTLALRIPGEGNGILASEQDAALRSEFRMPYQAPEDGYLSSWTWRNARSMGKSPGSLSTFVDERYLGRNFIFRVRSVLDAEGRVVKAWYGKIHSPFLLDPRGERGCGTVDFT